MIFLSRSLTTILAGTCTLFSSLLMAAPDQIWINGDVHTSNPEASVVEAFALENGKFMAVGSNDQIRALADEYTDVRDLGGKAVIPGIIDGHFHLSSWLYFGKGVNLTDSNQVSSWVERAGARAAKTPKGKIIFGGGWGYKASGELPTAASLDMVTPDHPVLLLDLDHHTLWVNSKSLERFNITADTPNPPGGEIVKDPMTGKPTGILKETAAFTVLIQALASLSKEERAAIWQEGIAYVNSLGITGLHNMGFAHELEELMPLVDRQEFPLRMWFGAFAFSGEEVEAMLPLYQSINQRSQQQRGTGPRLAFGYIKAVADGVVATRTAALLDEYNDASGAKGGLSIPPQVIYDIIAKANNADIPVAVHAIGDAAVRTALDAFAASPRRPTLPNRIEHAELVKTEDLKRFEPLGVAASMQPRHAVGAGHYYPTRVGEKRYQEAFLWQRILDSGAAVAFGSDWPTEKASPLILLQAAITRRDLDGTLQGDASQAVNFDEALYAMTQQNADLSGWGDQLGSISVGKWADFVVLDQPLPKPIDQRLLKLNVEATYIAGDTAYQASPEFQVP